jgi:hypothetical protein
MSVLSWKSAATTAASLWHLLSIIVFSPRKSALLFSALHGHNERVEWRLYGARIRPWERGTEGLRVV